MLAAQMGNPECLMYLIKRGADLNLKDGEGISAAEYCSVYPLLRGEHTRDKRDKSRRMRKQMQDHFRASFDHIRDNSTKNTCIRMLEAIGAGLDSRTQALNTLPFVTAFLLLIGGITTYFSLHQARLACETVYDGMVLQPYILIVANVVTFKIFQFLFEKTLVPLLDYSWFVLGDWITTMLSCCCYCYFRSTDAINIIGLKSSKIVPLPEVGADVNNLEFKKTTTFCNDTENPDLKLHKLSKWQLKQLHDAFKSSPQCYEEGCCFSTPWLFMYFQLVSCIVSTSLSAYAAFGLGHSTGWQAYTNFYAVVLNSNLSSTLTSMLFFYFFDGRLSQLTRRVNPNGVATRIIFFLISVPIFILIPCYLTHLIPGFFLYGWTFIIFTMIVPITFVGSALGLLKFFAFCFIRPKRTAIALTYDLAYRVLCLYMFQIMFNYASFFYDLPYPITASDYTGVIVKDFQLRSQSKCFIDKMFQADMRVPLQFFSWV